MFSHGLRLALATAVFVAFVCLGSTTGSGIRHDRRHRDLKGKKLPNLVQVAEAALEDMFADEVTKDEKDEFMDFFTDFVQDLGNVADVSFDNALWKMMVDYHAAQSKKDKDDPWDGIPKNSFNYSETLEDTWEMKILGKKVTVHERCNFVSNFAQYHVARRIGLGGKEFPYTISPGYKDDLIFAFSLLGFGSSFFHASGTDFGQDADIMPISLISHLIAERLYGKLGIDLVEEILKEIPNDNTDYISGHAAVLRIKESLPQKSNGKRKGKNFDEIRDVMANLTIPSYETNFGLIAAFVAKTHFGPYGSALMRQLPIESNLRTAVQERFQYIIGYRQEGGPKQYFESLLNGFTFASTMGFAFIFQEEKVNLNLSKDVSDVLVSWGAQMAPALVELGILISKGDLQPVDEYLATGSKFIYPGRNVCKSPHALWHEGAANGLYSLVQLTEALRLTSVVDLYGVANTGDLGKNLHLPFNEIIEKPIVAAVTETRNLLNRRLGEAIDETKKLGDDAFKFLDDLDIDAINRKVKSIFKSLEDAAKNVGDTIVDGGKKISKGIKKIFGRRLGDPRRKSQVPTTTSLQVQPHNRTLLSNPFKISASKIWNKLPKQVRDVPQHVTSAIQRVRNELENLGRLLAGVVNDIKRTFELKAIIGLLFDSYLPDGTGPEMPGVPMDHGSIEKALRALAPGPTTLQVALRLKNFFTKSNMNVKKETLNLLVDTIYDAVHTCGNNHQIIFYEGNSCTNNVVGTMSANASKTHQTLTEFSIPKLTFPWCNVQYPSGVDVSKLKLKMSSVDVCKEIVESIKVYIPKLDCFDNDEARSMLLVGPISKGFTIKVGDHPRSFNKDDVAEYILQKPLGEGETICIESFEISSSPDPKLKVLKHGRTGGLDGKVSQIQTTKPSTE